MGGIVSGGEVFIFDQQKTVGTFEVEQKEERKRVESARLL